MGRNEIKMKRKMVTQEQVHRYRDYSLLMKKYKRTQRFKRSLKIFTWSIVVTLVTVLLLVLISWLMVR
jgi:hypothetical protein